MRALLKAQMRHVSTKSALRQFRKQGYVPAVVYGSQKSSKSIAVTGETIRVAGFGGSGLYELDIEGDGKYQVLLQEVQRHPITGAIVHIDLHQVSLDNPVDVEVPTHITGQEAVEKRGGIVQQDIRNVMVHCLPERVPEQLLVNIEELQIGDSIHAGDIPLPDGVAMKTDPDTQIVTVVAPRAIEQSAVDQPTVVHDTEGKGAPAGV